MYIISTTFKTKFMENDIKIPDFKARKAELIAFGEKVYLSIVNAKGRTDDKNRTGISIFLGDPNSRNFIKENCYSPSTDAMHFSSEKVTRMMTLGQASSANSADPENMKFPGAVRIKMEDGTIIAASGSGLKGEEDALHSIIMLAYAIGWTVQAVWDNIISYGGYLPMEILYDDCYLNALLLQYE